MAIVSCSTNYFRIKLRELLHVFPDGLHQFVIRKIVRFKGDKNIAFRNANRSVNSLDIATHIGSTHSLELLSSEILDCESSRTPASRNRDSI